MTSDTYPYSIRPSGRLGKYSADQNIDPLEIRGDAHGAAGSDDLPWPPLFLNDLPNGASFDDEATSVFAFDPLYPADRFAADTAFDSDGYTPSEAFDN